MPSIESFATKRGVARFTDDAVRFDESLAGYLRSLYTGYWRSAVRWRKAIFVGYLLAVPLAFVWVVRAIRAGDVLLLAGVLAVLVTLQVVDHLRGFRSPDRVPLDAVEAVSATRGEKGLTRPRLVVTYVDDGSRYRRRVNLPSRYVEGGEATYERAIEAFRERGFEVR